MNQNKLNSRAKRKQVLVYFPVKLLSEIRTWCDTKDIPYSGAIVMFTAMGWDRNKLKENKLKKLEQENKDEK